MGKPGTAARFSAEPMQMAELVVDLWRVRRRAQRDGCESVLLACDRAFERIGEMGLSIEEMVGALYHPNMRVRVVHREGGANSVLVSECLSPAVYLQVEGEVAELIKPAEVVVRGKE